MAAHDSEVEPLGTDQWLGIDDLREVVGRVLSESPEIAAVYAFGSRVAGRPLPSSDLDLAFVAREDADLSADPLLAERLTARVAAELRTSVEIDGHLADRLPLNVRGRVVTEGVLLYEAAPELRVEFETSTRRLYFDFLPFIERDAREALLGGG
jgi:predicted nucleotidyltransferase